MMVINITNLKNIATKFGCKFVENASMKDYTTFRTGGTCPLLISPNSVSALSEILKICKNSSTPYTVLGNGSNVLVSDDGIDGVVIHIADDLNKITLLDETTIFCEAGVKLGTLCNFALENSLAGLEFAFGIPGSVGGAVYMNAGAYKREMADILKEVLVLDVKTNVPLISLQPFSVDKSPKRPYPRAEIPIIISKITRANLPLLFLSFNSIFCTGLTGGVFNLFVVRPILYYHKD